MKIDFPATYPRPPIVEALVEFRFAAGSEDDENRRLDRIAEALREEYPVTEEQSIVQFKVTFSDDVDGKPSTVRRRAARLLKSEDGIRIVRLAPGSISVHALAPYPGWERLIGRVEDAAKILAQSGVAEYSQISIRYIDKLVLKQGRPFSAFLNIIPPCTASMPSNVHQFNYAITSTDERDKTLATLTVFSEPRPGEPPTLVLDVNLARFASVELPLNSESWKLVASDLHARQRLIFEEAITTELRETFV